VTGDPGESVGYKRPPRRTQFRSGQSGNPRGRPKGTRNLATDLSEELATRIPFLEDGRRLRLSKQQVLVKVLVGQGLAGDSRAITGLLQLLCKLLPSASGQMPPGGGDLDADDLAILEDFLEREIAARRVDQAENPPATDKDENSHD
jgi:hypothetical protein